MKLMKKKVILIPYPAHGHVTPMLQLASVLPKFGLKPVVIVPEFIHHRLSPQINERHGILCISIPDGLHAETPRDFFSIDKAMEDYFPSRLDDVVGELNRDEGDDGGILCFIVDLLASWAINVGNKYGVQVAGFWPAMQTTYRLIAAIPAMVRSGIISEDGCPLHKSPIRLYPGQPTLTTDDLPWLIGSSAARSSRFKFWSRTLDRSNTLNWLLMNTFPDEFHQKQLISTSCTQGVRQNFQIGPLNMHSTTSRISSIFWQEDKSCLEWLNNQNDGSVVYVSFGSWVSPLEKLKVNNLAMALEASWRPFLWVLGPSWRQGLPLGYVERMLGRGRIVSWAPQMEVLQHEAVACYLTHCGWNSIMEAIQCKKPLLCYPVAGDQFVNCAYIVDAWKIGVKINGFGRRELEEGFTRLMEDNEISQRILRLNEKLFGNEGRSKAMANLANFVQDIKKLLLT